MLNVFKVAIKLIQLATFVLSMYNHGGVCDGMNGLSDNRDQ